MNVQFNLPQNSTAATIQFTGSERGATFHRENTPLTSQRTEQSFIVDASVLEVATIRQGFFHRLSEGSPSEAFTLLHSEIMENYDGEDRDKRIAMLHSVGADMGIEMRTVNSRGHTTVFNADGWTVNTEMSDGWVLIPGMDTHANITTLHQRGTTGVPRSAALFNAVFKEVGIEGGMALFETIHQELHRLFDGDELQKRLQSLKEGFETAGYWFQHTVADRIVRASEHYTLGDELTPQQREANERIRVSANDITAHLGDMFRSALEFFLATGSFAGFFDTTEANPSDLLSFRDVEALSAAHRGGATPHNIISSQGLSNYGNVSLQRLFNLS